MPQINMDSPKVKARHTFADKLKNLLTQTFQEPVDVRLSKLNSGYWIFLSFHRANTDVQCCIAAVVSVLETLKWLCFSFTVEKPTTPAESAGAQTGAGTLWINLCRQNVHFSNLSLDVLSCPKTNMFLYCFSVSKSFHKRSTTTTPKEEWEGLWFQQEKPPWAQTASCESSKTPQKTW